jgi:hypothetical protein
MRIKITEIPVYYINLDKDVERREACEEVLTKAGFSNINRFSGILGETKVQGVALSHLSILKKLQNEQKPFIIFEDDIQLAKFSPYLDVPDDADAYYLGNSFYGLYNGRGTRQISVEQINPNTFRIYNMLAAHAIAYFSQEYVDFLIRAIEFSINIRTNQDKARANTMKFFKIYASRSPLFAQGGVNARPTRISLPGQRFVGPERAY